MTSHVACATIDGLNSVSGAAQTYGRATVGTVNLRQSHRVVPAEPCGRYRLSRRLQPGAAFQTVISHIPVIRVASWADFSQVAHQERYGFALGHT